MPEYVTCEDCQSYRDKIYCKDEEQSILLARLDAQTGIQNKLMWAILGVLLAQFIANLVV